MFSKHLQPFTYILCLAVAHPLTDHHEHGVRATESILSLPATAPSSSQVVPKDLVSLSIELSTLPYFTGLKNKPNELSKNLLHNLEQATGKMPLIRVGGNTQDLASYVADQKEAVVKIDKKTVHLGPSFFDSFTTWSDLKFTVGINAKTNVTENWSEMVARSCKALESRLVMWEVGNEPDLWHKQGPDWTAADYAAIWRNRAEEVQKATANHCPSQAKTGFYGFSLGSKDLPATRFTDIALFNTGAGKEAKTPILQISNHNYLGEGSTAKADTLQNDLMNHTFQAVHLDEFISLRNELRDKSGLPKDTPFTIGETNSLTGGGGSSGTADVFGAALWIADYALLAANKGIDRLHFHQCPGCSYTAWEPGNGGLQNNNPPAGTKPPYYGKLFAATMIGTEANAKIADIKIASDHLAAAYATYDNAGLKRVAVINSKQWISGDGERKSKTFTFDLPDGNWKVEKASWLVADKGARATSGITFDGKSYDGSSRGTPVEKGVKGVTDPKIEGGKLVVRVRDTEGVIVALEKM